MADEKKAAKKDDVTYVVTHGAVQIGENDKRRVGVEITEAELGGAENAKKLIAAGTIKAK